MSNSSRQSSRDIALLKDAVLFSVSLQQGMGNRKAIPTDRVETDAAPERTSASVRLLESPELKAITRHLSETKKWCLTRCVPSHLYRGINLIKLSETIAVDAYVDEANAKLRDELIPAFLAVYPAQIEDARKPKDEGGLGALWCADDYPDANNLRNSFGISHSFISFGVPDGLPEELKAKAAAKIEARFQEASDQIIGALRAGFQQLVTHAVERLQPGEDGKPRVFRDSLFTNFTEFFETFDCRNLMEDSALAEMVTKAKAIVQNITPDQLREQDSIREQVLAQFKEVAEVTDALVVAKPARKFDLGGDE